MRTIYHSVGDSDSTLAQFEKCFRDLRECILGLTILNTENLVWRVVNDAQRLGA